MKIRFSLLRISLLLIAFNLASFQSEVFSRSIPSEAFKICPSIYTSDTSLQPMRPPVHSLWNKQDCNCSKNVFENYIKKLNCKESDSLKYSHLNKADTANLSYNNLSRNNDPDPTCQVDIFMIFRAEGLPRTGCLANADQLTETLFKTLKAELDAFAGGTGYRYSIYWTSFGITIVGDPNIAAEANYFTIPNKMNEIFGTASSNCTTYVADQISTFFSCSE